MNQRIRLLKHLHGNLNLSTDIWLSLRFKTKELAMLKEAARLAKKRLVTYVRDVLLTNAVYRIEDAREEGTPCPNLKA